MTGRAAALLLAAAVLTGCGKPPPTPPAAADSQAAARVVTLAPHLTELVYTAGAGDLLVGVSAYSDFPPAARELPVVSDAFTVDQERLSALRPDLVLAWESGTPRHVVDELRATGYRLETIRTRGLADIATAIETIGALTARPETARRESAGFTAALDELRAEYADRTPITVFFQVSERPLYTINGSHYIGEILERCGGRNIFSALGELAPAVTVESVVDRNPEVLLAGSPDGNLPFEQWARWEGLAANRLGNRFVVDADQIGRPTTRVVSAARATCEALETARQRKTGG